MKGRVLIVEDERLIALYIEEMLTHAGYDVADLFPSGEDALAHLASSPSPDIILMDIGLAGSLNGIETARRIREKADIPVIFLTAYNDRLRLSEAPDVSPYWCLTKPFTEEDLVAALETALLQARSSRDRGI
jgi:CheY-like chemotaxis protein